MASIRIGSLHLDARRYIHKYEAHSIQIKLLDRQASIETRESMHACSTVYNIKCWRRYRKKRAGVRSS